MDKTTDIVDMRHEDAAKRRAQKVLDMQELSVVVATDDDAFVEKLANTLSQPAFDGFEFTESVCNQIMLSNALDEQRVDILLVDTRIVWDGLDSVSVVDNLVDIRDNVAIIFVCSEANLADTATRIYDVAHVALVVCPLEQGPFLHALELAASRIERCSEIPFFVHTREGGRVISPRSVSYVESDRRILLIHEEDQIVRTYGKLSEIAQKLPSYFIQCHKSFLVNMALVKEMRADSVVLVTGDVVPVSQRRRRATREALEQFVGRTL